MSVIGRGRTIHGVLEFAPIQFGLLLIGPLYGLVSLAINLGENIPARRAVLEPAIVTALCWGLSAYIR